MDQDKSSTDTPFNVYSIEYFLNENKLLKSQVHVLNNENSNLKSENFKLNMTVNSKNDEIMIFQNKLERQEKLNSDISNKIKNSQDENERLQEELHKLIDESKIKTNSLIDLGKEINYFHILVSSLKNDIYSKDIEISKYQSEIKDLNVEKTTLTNQIFSLKNNLTNENFLTTSLNNDLNSLRALLSSQENIWILEKNSLKLSIANSNENLLLSQEEAINLEQRLNIRLHEIVSENKNLKFQFENIECKLSEHTLNIELKERKIEELSKVIIEIQKHVKQSERETKLMQEIINDKENEIKNLYSVKKRLDEYARIEMSIARCDVISVSDIEAIKNEYKKISAMYTTMKKDLEVALKNNEAYREMLRDYDLIKEKYEKIQIDFNLENSNYMKLVENFEELTKENIELQRDNEILNDFADKISSQNKHLLLEIKLGEGRSSLLSTNLSKGKYEDFIYSNINELEARFSEITKRYIIIAREKDKLQDENGKFFESVNEKNKIINNLEEGIKELEEINKNIKKQYEILKHYSESHYSIFTLKFSSKDREDNETELLNNLQYKLEANELQIKGLTLENENLIKGFKEIENKFSSQSSEVLKLKNISLEKDKENNNLNSNLTRVKTQLVNDQTLNNTLSKENASLRLQYEQLRSMSDTLFREKEGLIINMKITIEQINLQLTESKLNMNAKLEKIVKENEVLKEILYTIKKDIFDISKLDGRNAIEENILLRPAHNNNNNNNNNNNDNEDVKLVVRELNNLKGKFLLRDREFLKLKEIKNESEIKLENIQTENWTLKNQNEYLENRVKFYQNLTNRRVGETGKQVLRNEEAIEAHDIEEASLMNQNQNININYIETEIDNDKQKEEDKLYQKYLECLRENEELTNINKRLRIKNEENDNLNKNLVQNDIGASYKYLFRKMEESNNLISVLEAEKINLMREKEKIYENFAFINLQNEALKRNSEFHQNLVKELSEKIVNLESRIEIQTANIELYAQSNLVLEEKENTIKNLIYENNTLLENGKIMEKLISEKDDITSELYAKFNLITETKNKEVGESKAKYFKMFYVAFKRAKNVIEVLLKLKDTLEDKINSITHDHPTVEDKDFNQILIKLNNYEQIISQLKQKIKEIEINYSNTVSNLNKELELQYEKEKTLVNEIRTFKNINQIEGGVDMKIHFIKMLKSLTSAMNIVKFKEVKIKSLEKDLEVAQSKLERAEGESNVVDLTKSCDMCENLTLQVNSMRNSNYEILSKFRNEENENNYLKRKLVRSEIESSILRRDFKGVTDYVTEKEAKELHVYNNQNILPSLEVPKSQVEKNKIFTTLMNQMRKATRIITMLEKHTKNLENKMI